MRAVIGFLVGVALGMVLIVGAIATGERSGRSASPPPRSDNDRPTPLPSPAPPAAVADLFLVARMKDQTHWEELFFVADGISHSLSVPEGSDRTALPATDGTGLYFSVSGTPSGGIGEKRLLSVSLDGRVLTPITESTPLVLPRGLRAAPNGHYLTFFLDDRRGEQTELWVYDPGPRTTRVAVERLPKEQVRGPFFAPDGSFLLDDGERLLVGSPRRTGADLLPLPVPRAEVDWGAGLARSPGGDRVLLVLAAGDAGAPVARAVESRRGRERPTPRFSVGDRSLRILGWREPDTVVLASGGVPDRFAPANPQGGPAEGDRVTVWVLQGEERRALPLGTVAEVTLAGDGTTLSFLRRAGGETRLETSDLATGRTALVTTWPAASCPLPENCRLLQHLRLPRAAEGQPPVDRVPPDADRVLRAVTENIRVIADPPAGEPAVAERVWFTPEPRTVYVDYRVGTVLWRRLVRAAEPPEAGGVTVLAVFAPVGGEWVLARGTDRPDRTLLTLYEFEPDLGQWVEKPLAAGARP